MKLKGLAGHEWMVTLIKVGLQEQIKDQYRLGVINNLFCILIEA